MFKKLLEDFKAKRKKREELKKYEEFYKIVREGQMFIEFVLKDIELSKKNKMNRHQRRRFEKDICKNGKLTPEIVQYYKIKIAQVFLYIEQQRKALNRKPMKVKTEAPKKTPSPDKAKDGQPKEVVKKEDTRVK